MLAAACDDGRVYKLGEGYTVAACVCYDGPRPVGVKLGLIRVDGLEATGILAFLAVAACRGRPGVVLLDSVTTAGFNVASPAGISALTGAPVVVVYKYRPSYERLAPAAARAPGPAWARLKALRVVDEAFEVETRRGRLYLIAWRLGRGEAARLVESLQAHARTPEPLRAAHLIASAASRALLEG